MLSYYKDTVKTENQCPNWGTRMKVSTNLWQESMQVLAPHPLPQHTHTNTHRGNFPSGTDNPWPPHSVFRGAF